MLRKDEATKEARTACLPCRRSKRRCNRKIPRCNLCTQKDIECSYPTRRVAAQASPSCARDILTSERPSQSWAYAVYFISPHVFQQTWPELPRANLEVPPEVFASIGDTSSIRAIAAKFFKEIHIWLTIISKESFFVHLLNPLAKRQTELSLLTLCMKLCCTAPSDGDSQSTLYLTAKRFYHEVEMAGFLSLPVLQAGILIAFYELGQAIYPAAYITVGTCARYGLALGLDKYLLSHEVDSDKSRSWTEIEERRRVWWAVLIFDRYISLSNPLRPLSTEDPSFESFLPVDDTAWDQSASPPPEPVRISNGFTLKMGGLARSGQVAYLLSQALRIVAAPANTACIVSRQDEITQLRRTLIALVHAVDSESEIRKLEFCGQSALSLSTVLLLHENQGKIHDANIEPNLKQELSEPLCFETQTALDRLSSAALSYNETCNQNPAAADSVPIYIIHVMYQAASAFLELSRGLPDAETREKIETLKQFFRLISPRWRLAGVYLSVLESQEITLGF